MRLLSIALVLFATLPAVVRAQGVFATVNAGAQFASHSFTQEVTAPLFLTATAVDYPVENGLVFDLGGGAYLFENLWFGYGHLGLGASFSLADVGHEAMLRAQIPNPLTPGTPFRFDGRQAVDRVEKGFHMHLIGALPVGERLTISIYGGPSYLSVDQDIVEDLDIPPPGDFVITVPDVAVLHGSQWGFNAGVDVAYFFSEWMGVGAGARLTRASVTLENLLLRTATLEPAVVPSDVGGVQAMVGLRLRLP